MINAWSLLYEELNGTMDKTYPVENNELNGENIVINTGTGDTIFNVPSDVNDLDDDIEHSDAWYDYTRNDPDRENPFTDPKDRARADRVVGKTSDDILTIDGGDTLDFGDYPTSFTAFADNDDSIAHHVDSLTLNTEGQIKQTMSDTRNKYHEKEILQDVEDYVSRTYNGHYTGTKHEFRNVQTIDLMASRDLASDFCQANILKYGSRYGSKDGRNKGDLLKVIHYAMLLLHFDEHYGKPSMTSGNIDHNMP